MFKKFKPLICVRYYCTIKTKQKQGEMKYLNVAEKHDAAKTITALLSKGSARRREGFSVYNKVFDFEAKIRGQNSKMVMTSVSGHLLQLGFSIAYKSWNNCDPSKLFDAPVKKGCSEDYQPIKRTLEREIKSCQGLIIWTDCDREGENIGFEIIDVCRAIRPNIAVYRAKFSEITSAGIQRAIANLAQPDKRQSDAVDIRTELDLRSGAALTRFQTMRLQRLFPQGIADKLISYGSCQIPTLGFVAERYKEVEAFVSEPFWKIKVTHTIEDLTVEFNWARTRLFDKDACEDFLMICLSDPKAKVESVTTKPKNKWRPVAMDTVEMEKLGSRKLKLSAKETMTIAEKLYTQGLISYPRTETNSFSSEINLKALVEQQLPHPDWGGFASRVMEWGTNPRNGNKSDQAHPPIHPTKLITGLSGNEARVYELIVRHFLACVSKDATGSETIVNINIAGEKFSANGLCIFERNYLDVYPYDKWNAKLIHKYENGQEFDPTEISMQEGATTAPPLLTEADLIALMEKHGIGTDATHAEHINTIKERGYIGVVERGCLVPGVIGMGLYEGYDAMQLTLAKPLMRAEFEADLKKICEGTKNPQSVLSEQIVKYKEAYKQITEKVTAMDEKISSRINETPCTTNNPQSNDHQIQELFKCPKCKDAQMSLRKKKDKPGYFIGCLNYPNCKHAIWLPDDVKEAALSTNCSRCGAESKKIRIKFSTAYFRALFNVPTNDWYVACLRCDSKLRESLQINLDSVKATGNIVGDSASIVNTNSISNASSASSWNNNTTGSNFNGSSSNPSTSRGNQPSNPNQPKNPKQPKPPNPPKSPKAPKPPKPPKPPKQPKVPKVSRPTTISLSLTNPRRNNVPTNSRSISTSSSLPSTVNHHHSSTSHEVEADWFDDDGFDDILLETDFNHQSLVSAENVEPIRSTTIVSSNEPHLNGNNIDDWPDDSNDINFENYDWESLSNNRPEQSTTITSETWPTTDNDFEDYEWGSSSRRSNPAPKRTRTDGGWGTGSVNVHLSSPPTPGTPNENTTNRNNVNVNRNSFGSTAVGWGSSTSNEWGFNPTHKENVHNIKCTGCHTLAKELTVKKEGPNKGRIFYGCSKKNPCKFFQWADEEQPPEQPTSNYTGSRTNMGSNQNHQTSAGPTNTDVKCKCDIIAKSCTVRKDGPNKGRPFLVCANQSSSCGFFKWGDENSAPNQEDASRSQPSSSGSNSWGTRPTTSNNFTSVNRNETRNQAPPGDSKKRKCGLCRLEGHTRSKCPRKAEFE